MKNTHTNANPRKSRNIRNSRKSEGLTDHEQLSLLKCETSIAAHLGSLLLVGDALACIRKLRLYRRDFQSFPEYCRVRWRFPRSHAYRLIQSAEMARHLVGLAAADPKNERQIRPLAGLDPQHAKQAWRLANEHTKGRPITGKIVTAAVASLTLRSRSQSSTSDEEWQRIAKPLLLRAVRKTREGDRAAAEEFAFKALLSFEIGRSRP